MHSCILRIHSQRKHKEKGCLCGKNTKKEDTLHCKKGKVAPVLN
jgi:hypothetical protein